MLFIGAVSLGLSYVAPRTEAIAATTDTAPGMVSPFATLDTSRIDDLHGKGYMLELDGGELLLVPGGAVLETTPMILAPGTVYVVPEESPGGGHVLPVEQWLDGSPLYSDGWLLLVNDAQHDVQWRAPESNVSTTAAVQLVAHATTTDQPTAQERKAARLILARMKSGKRIAEDWTWRGAPRVVGQQNDVLLERFERTGKRFSKANQRAFLAEVATSKAQTGKAGKVRAEDGTYVPPSFYDHVRGPSKATCDHLGKQLVPDATYGTRCA